MIEVERALVPITLERRRCRLVRTNRAVDRLPNDVEAAHAEYSGAVLSMAWRIRGHQVLDGFRGEVMGVVIDTDPVILPVPDVVIFGEFERQPMPLFGWIRREDDLMWLAGLRQAPEQLQIHIVREFFGLVAVDAREGHPAQLRVPCIRVLGLDPEDIDLAAVPELVTLRLGVPVRELAGLLADAPPNRPQLCLRVLIREAKDEPVDAGVFQAGGQYLPQRRSRFSTSERPFEVHGSRRVAHERGDGAFPHHADFAFGQAGTHRNAASPWMGCRGTAPIDVDPSYSRMTTTRVGVQRYTGWQSAPPKSCDASYANHSRASPHWTGTPTRSGGIAIGGGSLCDGHAPTTHASMRSGPIYASISAAKVMRPTPSTAAPRSAAPAGIQCGPPGSSGRHWHGPADP